MDYQNTNQPSPYSGRGERVPPAESPILEHPLWRDKRCPLFGRPWSFTTYTLYADRLMVESGILTRSREEIRLYRITDVTMHQSLLQRIFRVGDLRLRSMDASTPRFTLRDIPNPGKVMELISNTANTERIRAGFGMMEFMNPGW